MGQVIRRQKAEGRKPKADNCLLPTAYCLLPSRRAQASLELTLAMIGALLLLFGSLKVFLWLNERIIARQIAYERSRVQAGTDASVVQWNEAAKPLRIFGKN